jgi:mono/diheme cytochrome c family protein
MKASKQCLAAVGGLALALVAFGPAAARQGNPSSATEPPKTVSSETGARATGAEVFDTNCAACHQKSGEGVVGAFPPLSGHVPESFAQAEGREYLPRVVLFGLAGKIAAKGDVYDGTMPAWPQLNDGQIAAVLNYIFHAWDNDKLLPPGFEAIKPSDIAAARAQSMSAAEVLAMRRKFIPETAATRVASGPVTFTAEQAHRGEATYADNCENCHGAELNDGEYAPPLKGPIFLRNWGNGSVAALYGKIKATMPFDNPGQLTDQNYLDVTAFLLRRNGYAAGDQELPAVAQAQEKMTLKK